MQNTAKSAAKKWSARTAATAMVVAAAVMVPAGLAQAATPNVFKLCNYGSDYDTVAEFPGRGGWSTYVISPGKCYSTTLTGRSNDAVNLVAYKGSAKYVYAGFSYNNATGINITTGGKYGAVSWNWS
ncbi:hypothetical protein [Streptomyces sp. NPDC093109]|uniref:hypothetical protein n=1 Tax=Streptomyces sp. NPDC093109 TaxID=3154977 RepID=UPI00344DC0A2